MLIDSEMTSEFSESATGRGIITVSKRRGRIGRLFSNIQSSGAAIGIILGDEVVNGKIEPGKLILEFVKGKTGVLLRDSYYGP